MLGQPHMRGWVLTSDLPFLKLSDVSYLKVPLQLSFIGYNISDNEIYFPVQDACKNKRREDVFNNYTGHQQLLRPLWINRLSLRTRMHIPESKETPHLRTLGSHCVFCK